MLQQMDRLSNGKNEMKMAGGRNMGHIATAPSTAVVIAKQE